MAGDTTKTSTIGLIPLSSSVVTGVQNVCDTVTDQDVAGVKTFSDGIVIGDEIESIGRDCLGVGNELTVGAYSFFYKGMDVDATNQSCLMFLCDEQPRYPFPIRIDGGDRSKVIMYGRAARRTVDWNDPNQVSAFCGAVSGTANYNPKPGTETAVARQMSSIFMCTADDPGRPDYNQLCADFGNTSYATDITAVHGKFFGSGGYVDQAFQPDGAFTSEGGMAKWKLAQNIKVGDVITFVNSDKTPYRRAGVVKGVLSGGAVLALDINDYKKYEQYWKNGTIYTTLEKDDCSLTFMDHPSLSGPSIYSCRSSLAVGEANSVIRRDSFAAGRQNVTEQDYCVALGRKAQALDYCSFVWSTQFGCKSAGQNTFTVGVPAEDLTRACKDQDSGKRSLYVGDKKGNVMEMHQYMLSCVIENRDLLQKTVMKVCDDQQCVAMVWKALSGLVLAAKK